MRENKVAKYCKMSAKSRTWNLVSLTWLCVCEETELPIISTILVILFDNSDRNESW